MNDYAVQIWSSIVAGGAAALAWLIRRVFTNEKQIAILLESQKHRDEAISEIKEDVKHLLRKGEK